MAKPNNLEITSVVFQSLSIVSFFTLAVRYVAQNEERLGLENDSIKQCLAYLTLQLLALLAAYPVFNRASNNATNMHLTWKEEITTAGKATSKGDEEAAAPDVTQWLPL